MYAKPSTFLRSSERKVTDPNKRLVIERERLYQRRLEAFESIGFTASAASLCVTRTPITDESRYDLEGVVYP